MAEHADFIAEMTAEMKKRNATQADVAAVAGISQAHLSRLLARKLPLTSKSKSRLQIWISGDGERSVDDRLRFLLEAVLLTAPKTRKALLPILETAVRASIQ